MSRHEGVSCDSCLKSNFRGRRYKCLICYDYDLCAACYESGATTSQHIIDHPMQCILTRSDFDLYYSGEALSLEQPQAYTCPFCNRTGFTDQALQEHVTAEHSETQLEVVCPVCASMPGGEPNLVTDDFAGHLTLEHRSGPRDLISFLDEPSSIRHGGVRRIPHSAGRGASRTRRSNMHFSSSGGLNSLSPSSRDAVVDPIAELLSQLSGVRRSQAAAVAAAAASGSGGIATSGTGSASIGASASAQPAAPNQLQQLQMQLQLERQQVSAARQQLERLPNRRQAAALAGAGTGGTSGVGRDAHHAHRATRDTAPSAPTDKRLLTDCLVAAAAPSAEEREAAAVARAERGALLRGLLLASLAPPPPPAPAPPPATAPPLPRRSAQQAHATPVLATPAPRADLRPLKAPPQQKQRAKGDQARTGPHLPDAR